MSITSKQLFQIAGGIIGGLITGAALLQTLFGQDLTLIIVAGLGVCSIILNSIGAVLFNQTNAVQEVLDMPGVERVRVNKDASPALATMAMDPKIKGITPMDDAFHAVAETAAKAA